MKKILIIRFSSIGDIVLTTPIIRTVKKKFPQAEIHFLTKKSFVDLISHNPHVSQVIGMDGSIKDTIHLLKNKQYDIVIDLHKNIRSKKVITALRKPTFSFDKLNIQKWLWVNLKWNLMPEKHLVDRYFEGVESLGIKDDGEGLDYFFSENYVWKNEFSLPEKYIIFAIGGTYSTKRMPFEKMRDLLTNTRQKVILIGGKEDMEVGEKLALNDQVTNLCGKLSIMESAYLIKFANSVITHDTGMMHIACALRKKVITIWGNTHPLLGFYPFYPKDVQSDELRFDFQVDLKCRPCSKLGKKKCPKGHFNCMNLQPIDTIRKVANI